MSTPQKPRPPKVAKSALEAHIARQEKRDEVSAERESLAQTQARFGRERRLEKMARKDPVFRGVLADLRSANEQLASKQKDIDALAAKLAARDAQLASQDEQLAAQDARIHKCEGSLALQRNRIAELEAQLAAAKAVPSAPAAPETPSTPPTS